MTDAEREQIKLRATLINNMANGVFVTGILGPVLALALSDAASTDRLALAALIALVCFPLVVVLHLIAMRHLKELDR